VLKYSVYSDLLFGVKWERFVNSLQHCSLPGALEDRCSTQILQIVLILKAVFANKAVQICWLAC